MESPVPLTMSSTAAGQRGRPAGDELPHLQGMLWTRSPATSSGMGTKRPGWPRSQEVPDEVPCLSVGLQAEAQGLQTEVQGLDVR